MRRTAYLQEIERRIGTRRFVWYGLAGGNAAPFRPLRQFSGAFSVIAPEPTRDRVITLERLSGERVDTVGYRLQPGRSATERSFYHALYEALSEPAVALTHEVSAFFASVRFLRRDFTQHLGLFHEWQAVFDHKPWVESELGRAGVRVLPWRYVPTHDGRTLIATLTDALRDGPLVLRANRSGGGLGLTLLRAPEDIPQGLETSADGYMAVSPYFHPSIPLNVNACIFPDGAISVHPPSLQLIGIPESAPGTFAYCGNDFARVRDLDAGVLDAYQEMTLRTGRWLASMGYVGAFGVDAILHDGTLYLTEVNPRFQGSSLLSARLEADLDRPDVFLAHAGAFLGVGAPEARDLTALAREQSRAAQIVARNRDEWVRRNDSLPQLPDGAECWLLPDPGVLVHPRALLARVVVRRAVTDDGGRLHDDVAAWFAGLPARLFDPVTPAAQTP